MNETFKPNKDYDRGSNREEVRIFVKGEKCSYLKTSPPDRLIR